MTDWSRLTHAYGSAADVPDLLDGIVSDPSPERWNDLWATLCHQGTVYEASFAALPRLVDLAGADDRDQAVRALVLAGAIVAGADRPPGADGVHVEHAGAVASLLTLANERLRTADDREEYVHLLSSVLAFEGFAGWGEDLAWGLIHEEYEVSCPACGADLFVVIGDRGFFTTSEDYALSDEDVESVPLRPAAPRNLDGVGRRLHDLALADGRREVAHALAHVFGDATCPDCAADFPVAARIGAEGPPAAHCGTGG
ncbi:hypothetical protein [Streptomyces sp. NPDC002490]|uniref:hypothetical protein n=1 Tax=Streptomyces sp. NPDC002490 TaxID=3154416 RepID=UPI003327701B